MAKADFDKGEYQWVAEITNAIVFADPTNIDARLLCRLNSEWLTTNISADEADEAEDSAE